MVLRYALLLGNAAYDTQICDNMPAVIIDLEGLKDVLESRGFAVWVAQNMTANHMLRAILDFSNIVNEARSSGVHVVSIVYFSGHGLANDDGNVGMVPTNNSSASHEWVTLGALTSYLSVPDTLNFIILDCCRNVPIDDCITGTIKYLTLDGIFNIFACPPNREAKCTPTGSIFTTALCTKLRKLDIEMISYVDLFRSVARKGDGKDKRGHRGHVENGPSGLPNKIIIIGFQ